MSELIVDLSLRRDLDRRHLNLSHPQTFALKRLIDAIIASDGAEVSMRPYHDWIALCSAHAASRNIASILQAEIDVTPEGAEPFGGARIGNALADLVAQGHACPSVDDRLLGKYVAWRNRAGRDAIAQRVEWSGKI